MIDLAIAFACPALVMIGLGLALIAVDRRN